MVKTYSTFAGARRAAGGKPVLRLLNDAANFEAFIVVPDIWTDIMALDAKGRADGDIQFASLSCIDQQIDGG